MLAQMTPMQLDRWWAAYRVGLDDSWWQVGHFSALLVDLFRWLASCIPGMPAWKPGDWTDPQDFVPEPMTGPRPKKERAVPMDKQQSLQVAKRLQAIYGNNR